MAKTTSIEKKTMDIEERGVRLRLTIVDTPGEKYRRAPFSMFKQALSTSEYVELRGIFLKFRKKVLNNNIDFS